MKTQRAVLPLAFLSAAFMLGCQDQGSEPVGPEALAPLFDPGGAGKNPTGKKKGGSVLADLTLGLPDPVTGEATGLVSLTLQEVAFKDGEGTIQFERGANDRKGIAGINLAFNLTETHSAGRVGVCEVTGRGGGDHGRYGPGRSLQRTRGRTGPRGAHRGARGHRGAQQFLGLD